MLVATLITIVLLAPAIGPVAIAGEVDDARTISRRGRAQSVGGVVLTGNARGNLQTWTIDAAGKITTKRPPRGTSFAANCGTRGLVFVDGDGVVAPDGTRLLRATPIFGGGAAAHLRFIPLCNEDGEIRLATAQGFAVLAAGQFSGSATPFASAAVTSTRTTSRAPSRETPRASPQAPAQAPPQVRQLEYPHQSRAYGGMGSAGLPRGYASAWTTYQPISFDANVDADPALEWVVVGETRVFVFDRDAQGALEPKPVVNLKLGKAFAGGIAPGASTRVVLGVVGNSDRAHLIVSQFLSPLAKSTRASSLSLDGHARRRKIFNDEGLSIVLGASQGRLYRVRVDTSVLALSSALITGEIGTVVESIDGKGNIRVVVENNLAVDVARGKLTGAIPSFVFDDVRTRAILLRDGNGAGRLRRGLRFQRAVSLPELAPEASVIDIGQTLLTVHQVSRARARVEVLSGAVVRGR